MEVMGEQPQDLTGASQKPEPASLCFLWGLLAWNDAPFFQNIAYRIEVQDEVALGLPRLLYPSSVTGPSQNPTLHTPPEAQGKHFAVTVTQGVGHLLCFTDRKLRPCLEISEPRSPVQCFLWPSLLPDI